MNIDYKAFLKHLETQGKVRETSIGTNMFKWGPGNLPAADEFKAAMRQDDPCDFCGRNDTEVPYMYISDEDKVVCMPCVDKKPWKMKKH